MRLPSKIFPIAVLDSSNPKVLKLYDIMNGKPTGNAIEHTNEIIDFELNNSEMSSERKIAFLDTNRDLFIIPALKKDVRKLVSMCDSFKWHDKHDMLSAAADLRVHSWYLFIFYEAKFPKVLPKCDLR
jgi:intraflagellar transport protein 80